ncbi:MAG: OmpH family outer membrane protein [Pirellulales bacterium]
MRTTLVSAVCAAMALAAFAFTYTHAQQPVQPPRGAASTAASHGVAVIDVTYILENYARLKAAGEKFKADVENTGKRFKAEGEALVKSAERLQTLKAGSPDYKKLEEELAQKQSDLKVKASLEEKNFAEQESQMYLAAYREVSNVVRVFAERNGISLVLRFNGKPVDANNRDAIRAEMFKTVLYNSPSIDITDAILAELNRGAVAAPTATRPGVPRPQ